MKLLKFCFLLFAFTAFYSCNEIHRDIQDEAPGTPTNADTVLPANHHAEPIHKEAEGAKKVPKTFRR